MLRESFYTNFSAYVQLAVAFGFGLLYLYKNNRSIFNSAQSVVFDAFRKNALFKWLLRYPTFIGNKVDVNNSPAILCKSKGYLQKLRNKFEAALDTERTCDYLSVLGILSGIYSVGWLIFIPWSQKYLDNAEELYLTLTLATIVADVVMVCRSMYNHLTRPKAFIFSVIVLTLCVFVSLTLYSWGWVLIYETDFDTLFLMTMAVPFAPISSFVLHLFFFMSFRLLLLSITLILSILLHPIVEISNR